MAHLTNHVDFQPPSFDPHPASGRMATRACEGMMMIRTVMLAGFLCIGGAAVALADGTCKSDGSDKKLAGAAMTSFMKKCQTDAKTTCDATAASKKLAGAAKMSFTKKCVSDAIGT